MVTILDSMPVADVRRGTLIVERHILLWLVDRRRGEWVAFGQVDESRAFADGVELTWTRVAPGELPRGW